MAHDPRPCISRVAGSIGRWAFQIIINTILGSRQLDTRLSLKPKPANLTICHAMSYLTQAFPPAPTFTEASLEDLSKKVYIITGATSGVGLELAKILYGANGTVYVCGRSKESTSAAISDIKGALPQSKGRLRALIFDLSSLASIRPAVDCFLAKEQRLDVLFLNAGVMTPPAGSRTTDGYDLELGSHCVAPFLLCRLLQPTLEATANWQQLGLDTLNRSEGTDESLTPSTAGNNIAPKSSSVRIVWVSSFINGAPNGGVQFDENTGAPKQMTGTENYLQSKAGEVLLAEEYNRRYSDKGVVNVVSILVLIRANASFD